jgi:PAS domain S-box-containing protein
MLPLKPTTFATGEIPAMECWFDSPSLDPGLGDLAWLQLLSTLEGGGVLALDLEGRYRYADRVAAERLGVAGVGLPGQLAREHPLGSLGTALDTARTKAIAANPHEAMALAVATGRSEPGDAPITVRADGHERVLELRAVPWRDPEGSPRGVIIRVVSVPSGSAVDQTPPAEALESGTGPTLTTRIADAAPLVLYVFDVIARRSVYVNREVWRDLGYTPEEIEAMGDEFLPRLLHPDDHAHIDAALARWESADDDQVLETEYRIRRADGTYSWFHGRNVVFERDESGRVRQILGSVQDLTARKEFEAALRQRELEYRLLLDAIPDLVFGLDTAGHFRYVQVDDPTALLEDPSEVQGRHFREILPRDVSSALEAAARRARETGARVPMSYRLTLGDGRTREYEARVSVAADGGTVAVCRDVTEQRLLETQLRQAQKMEAVGRLAGGVAHDFNNLLTVVLGGADIMLGDLPAGSPARQQLRDIRRAGERGAELTQKLLAFSRRQLVASQVVDVNAVVHGTEGILRRVIPEDIVLECRFSSRAGRADIDPTQLEQILLNLVVNARDAMPGGGRVVIETGSVEVDEARATASGADVTPGVYVFLSVADTGTGMSPETRAHLFEPFFTTKEQGMGSGLGLATSYGIAQQHGGFFEVTTALGEGTTMLLLLPMVDRPVTDVVPAESVAMPGGDEAVLLVEDDPAVRLMVARVLRQLGYEVRTANDGVEALRYVDSGCPHDLLVTDLVMPRMGGHDLAVEVRRRCPVTRILFVTGYSEDVSLGEITEAPGSAVLRKPFSIQVLAQKVRALLDDHASPESSGKVSPSAADRSRSTTSGSGDDQ